ncbi:MAG: sigma 54-interacting transcriptional regulator [Kofleriaceae bacterium]
MNGTEYPLDLSLRKWVVGSSESCDLVVEDPFVSSAHCTLERKASGALLVRDRQSRNGTYVDSNSIEAGELRAGAHLVIGKTTLVAEAAAGKEPASALEMMRGRDPVLLTAIDQALKAADRDCNVLVVGETGTGKDLLARIIHESSRRAAANFVTVNCGAIPRELIGSELFGHERGAFTGAANERDGYFVEAHHGTLFLDEIGELPMEMQPHLLRVLESRRVRRIGGSYERPVDVRIVSATNRIDNLGTESSRLRTDIYHRLAHVVIVLPPLRERMGDLVELVESMLTEMAPDTGPRSVSEQAWKVLAAHAWPGNVRELRGAVSRAVTLGGEELQASDFFPQMHLFGRSPQLALLADVEADKLVPYQAMLRGAMEQALARFGTIRAAAEHLGMAKSTFADKARAWGLVPRRKVKLPKFPVSAVVVDENDNFEMTDEMDSEDLSIVRDGIVADVIE